MNERTSLISKNEQDLQKDLMHNIITDSIEYAEDWFIDAKERLLDVNKWSKYSSLANVNFSLADHHGKALSRHARKGDFISINILRQDSREDKSCWIAIEAIEYDDYPDIDMETFAMFIRPSLEPRQIKAEMAHFSKNIAIGAIIIERRGKHLTGSYHRRGGPKNTTTLFDKWPNISDRQLHDLIKGFIEDRSI